MSIFAAFLGIIVLVIYIAITNEYEAHKKRLVENQIAWEILEDSGVLIKDLNHALHNIDSCKYFINYSEIKIACAILSKFKEDRKGTYLYCHAHCHQGLKTLKKTEFDVFVFHLAIYLDDHWNEYEEYNGLPNFKRIEQNGINYEVTEQGVVYFKLLYMTYLYCQVKNIPNKKASYYIDKWERIIQNGTVEFVENYRSNRKKL